MLSKIETPQERQEKDICNASLSATINNKDWSDAILAESETGSDASPVVTAAALLVVLRLADENLQQLRNTGMFGYMLGRRKYNTIRNNAIKLAQAALRLQGRLECSLAEERHSGMMDDALQQQNRQLVSCIERGVTGEPRLASGSAKQLRLLTIGLMGDRVKQAEHLDPARDRLGMNNEELLDLHQVMHESWERCKRIKENLLDGNDLSSLINRFHTLCIAMEDAMPNEIRRTILAGKRHAM